MKPSKKWTLKSIAAHLGVSNATVSNAFNRPDQLSKARRESILEACKELGYTGPNQAARSLRKGQSNIIALVLPDSVEYMVSDPVASEFMRGVSSELEKHQKNILLYSGRSNDFSAVHDFVDGFVAYGRPRNPKLIEQLNHLNKPTVTVDFQHPSLASVNIDNHQAAYDIAKITLTDNYSGVAVMGLRLLDSDTLCRVYDQGSANVALSESIAHQRLAGYKQALNELDITLGADQIWNIPESTIRYAKLAAKEALSQNQRPNVLLCMSDLIAIACIDVAQELGLHVGQDIRIVGFDGIEQGQIMNPKVTTVAQNSYAKGVEAAQLLQQPPKQSLLSYTIIKGSSG